MVNFRHGGGVSIQGSLAYSPFLFPFLSFFFLLLMRRLREEGRLSWLARALRFQWFFTLCSLFFVCCFSFSALLRLSILLQLPLQQPIMSTKRPFDVQESSGGIERNVRARRRSRRNSLSPSPSHSPSPPPPPAPRTILNVDSNALEVIFSFCSIADLSHVRAARRHWAQFLGGTAHYAQIQLPLRLRQWNTPYGAIRRSSLRRHVTTLILDNVSICTRMTPLFPRLTEVKWWHADTGIYTTMWTHSGMDTQDWALSEAALWPQHLQKLRLLGEGESQGNQLLIDVVTQLSTLTLLDVRLIYYNTLVHPQQVDLTPLRRLSALHSLTSIDSKCEDEEAFLAHSDTSWLSQRVRFCLDLANALAVPLLLPSLRVLHLSWERKTAEFLAQLPQLTELVFIDRMNRPDGLTAEHMLPLLQGLNALTSLKLENSKLTSNHLTQLLPRLPLLTHLSLVDCEQLGSDGFLATPSLAHTLTHLTLVHPHFANVDFTPLKALTHLILVFDGPPTPEELTSWRRLRPRWQDPAKGGTAQPHLVEFQLLVGDVDAFSNVDPNVDPDVDPDVQIVRVVKKGH